MTNKQRFWIFALMDSFIILTAVLYGIFLVNAYITAAIKDFVLFGVMFILLSLFFSMVFKLYRKAWEYAKYTAEQLKERLFMLADDQRARTVGLVMEG